MSNRKKLIEVALPLEAINAESAREKSIRHGHPSTLHLWWARRPLAAARAVIFSSLVDDPSSHPEQFPTEEAQALERERLFGLIEELVKWENANKPEVLAQAKAEILKYTNGNPPALLDPFAGGGAIPLEAQRLGLEAHASDLNPVAVMINKAMIEIPPKFAGRPPMNPEAQLRLDTGAGWQGTQGLAEDVRYYGEWMKQEAFKCIGHLYPKVKVPKEQGGGDATVIAWIWARTVKCPNPACGCEMPLASSFELSKKKGKEAYIQPIIEEKVIRYEVRYGKNAPESPKTARGAKFKCVCCGEATMPEYIKAEAVSGRMGAVLMAIVAEGKNDRLYISPNEEHIVAAQVEKPEDVADEHLPIDPRAITPPQYGLTAFRDLFTARQLTTITTFSDLIVDAQGQVVKDGGSKEYAQAVAVYLAFGVSRMADINNALCRWEISKTQVRNLFNRQAIPMIWDFAENNAFGKAAGGYTVSLSSITKVIENFRESNTMGIAKQHDAQSGNSLCDNTMVSTDPPYYDNVPYANISDFFYIWLRRSLKSGFPELFASMLTPKSEELVAAPYRFDGDMIQAQDFFETGMKKAFQNLYNITNFDYPLTVFYAFKQTESEESEVGAEIASTGWETMLSAIVQAGFAITGTWPMRTELGNRMRSFDSNALASSIVLVCRKRSADAPICTRRDFINALKRELKPAVKKLQASNIAPVDLAQSAIGPGMGVYSRLAKVLEADGSPMSVRSALQIINQELDHYFTEQDGELDRDSRFCVELFSRNAFNDMKFGEADVLARAKNTSVDKLAGHGVLYAKKGVVHLLTREEIPSNVDSTEPIIWLLTQQLTRAMETGGVAVCATIITDIFGANAEQAKSLAYRLFTIAEQKGWAQEALAYNSLVIAWPEIQARAVELHAQSGKVEQIKLMDTEER